ncbi:helix-turn-helix domain-containing protein [Aliiroseovarius sp. YM-037]|uniref:helix-turn-helix domain-containing protein n=1 Tax=Aliiroseovarius sp. YM-037 TaxID=3341728 RepID=UPI003A7FB454
MPTRVLTGTRIRNRRSALGLKQTEVATTIGISPSYLNLIEHNRRRIGGKLLGDLARALRVDVAALSEGAETALLTGLRSAAALSVEPPAELDRVEELAGRFPGWAECLAAHQRRVEQLERTVETLSDRLTHDPYLSTSMHDVLSTVTSIRSTASILAEPGDIDPNWQARFQKNIHEDARRLSESAQALVTYLDGAGDAERSLISPQEELEDWLDDIGGYVAGLEDGTAEAEDLVAANRHLTTDAARRAAAAYLAGYTADAEALPMQPFREAAEALHFDPMRLAAQFGVSVDRVFRRLATQRFEDDDQRIGLVECDGSGTLTFRRPIPGFQLPHFGAACPLWPLYRALSQPAVPVRMVVEQAGRDTRKLIAFAFAQMSYPEGFDGPAVLKAQMVLVPSDLIGATSGMGMEVGQTCRICPKPDCVARREESILSDQS